MKKIIFGILLSVLFIPCIYALDITLVAGGSSSYVTNVCLSYPGGGTEFMNYVDCTGATGSHYKYYGSGTNSKCFTWYDSSDPTTDGTDYVKCTYTKSGDEGYVTFGIKYTAIGETVDTNIKVNLNEENPSFSISDYYKINKMMNYSGDTDKFTINGCSKGSTYCTFTAKNPATSGNYTINATFMDNYGNTRKVTFNIKTGYTTYSSTEQNIFISVGGYGSCDLSGWGESDKIYYKKYTDGMKLPNCTPYNTTYMKFNGWSPLAYSRAGSYNVSEVDATANECVNTSGYVANGSTIDGSASTYAACYSFVDAFQLVTDGGNIVNKSNLTYYSGAYIYKSSLSYTLPDVTPADSTNFKFVGWLDSRNGQVYPKGTTLTLTSGEGFVLLRAQYEKIKTADSHTYEVYINAYDNESKTLEELVDVDGITFKNITCDSNSYFKLNGNIITPIKSGEANVYAYSITDGVTDSYTITVHVYNSNSGNSVGSATDIPTDNSVAEYYEATYSDLTQEGTTSFCKYYTISSGYSTGKYINGGFKFNLYSATSKCDGTQYRSLCLDPGLYGPGGATYVYGRSLNLEYAFDRAIHSLASQVADEEINLSSTSFVKRYAAVNFLARLFSFEVGWNRSSPIAYQDNYNVYAGFAKCNTTGVGSTFVNDKSKCGGYTITDSEFLGYVQDYYEDAIEEFNTEYTTSYNSEYTVTMKDEEKTYEWSSDHKVLTFTWSGKIKLPEDAINPSFSSTCNGKYDCGTGSRSTAEAPYLGTSMDVDGYRDFKLQVKVTVDKNTPSPSAEGNEMAFILNFDSSQTLNNAFIAYHLSANETHQRMVVINKYKPQYYMYIDLKSENKNEGCDIQNSALNPDNCTESNCSAINEDMFETLNCCSFIEDKSSYAYKHLCISNDCTYDNFLPVCSNDYEYDAYRIGEASDSNGDSNYSCIVKVDSLAATESLTDGVGNSYALDSYYDNRYCRVSCKEDWYFNTGAYSNFTGNNAVLAGSYFQLKDNVFVGAKRTCVTTYIDINQYNTDVHLISQKMINEWNNFSILRSEYTALEEEHDAGLPNCVMSYKDYYSGSAHTHWDCDLFYCTSTFYCKIWNYTCDTFKTNPNDCTTDEETGEKTCNEYTDEGENLSHCATTKKTTCKIPYTEADNYKGQSKNVCVHYYNPHTLENCKYDSHATPVYIKYDKKPYSQGAYQDQEACREFTITTGPAKYTYLTDQDDGEQYEVLEKSYTYKTNNTVQGYDEGLDNIYRNGSVVEYGTYSHYTGSCDKEIYSCEKLYEREHKRLIAAINSSRAPLSGYINTLNSYATDFAKCQNFQLITTSLYNELNNSVGLNTAFDGTEYYTPETGTVGLSGVSAQNIETKYSPFIKYTYEEEEYMQMIGSDNYMTPYTAINGGYVGTVKKNESGSKTEDLYAVQNLYSTTGYGNETTKTADYYNQMEDENASNGATKLDGLTKFGSWGCRTWVNGVCTESKPIYLCPAASGYETIYSAGATRAVEDYARCIQGFFYYYPYNYVKQSLYNGSYWKNKGYWYINGSDEKSHADTLSVASSRSYVKYGKGDEDYWSLYGGYNVFPISMDTRRDLYQYVYLFYNIGQYNDGALGRIMGGEVDLNGTKKSNGHTKTVFSSNSHVCFYEVYESICRCCGAVVEQTINKDSGVDTWYYAPQYGYSMSDGDESNTLTLAFYTNTVSLANFTAGTNRVLGANWSAQTPFFYSGDIYSTNQGAELLTAIQTAGDSIYDKYPDYSFTLTPSAMAEIREYNDTHTYVISSDDLINYGNIAFSLYDIDGKKSYSSYIVSDDDESYRIRYIHYGSKFLEKNMKQYITSEYRGHTLIEKTGSNVICQTTNVAETFNSTSSCRWVDYITTSTSTTGGGTKDLRLAFK